MEWQAVDWQAAPLAAAIERATKLVDGIKQAIETNARQDVPFAADSIRIVKREPETNSVTIAMIDWGNGGAFRQFVLSEDAAQKLGALLVDPEGNLDL